MEDVKMEKINSVNQITEMENQHSPRRRRRKGGLITIPFIIGNEAFEKVASYGLIPNMILYLMKDYHISVAKGTNILFFWQAATNFMPLFAAFLSDSYLGRFLTIGLASISTFLGMVVLWITTMAPKTKPPPCNFQTQICKSATPAQMTLLLSSFVLMSIGAGGVRPCSLAFGADQLDNKNNPKNDRVLESYFGWYYASSAISVIIALTGIVYIQVHLGWRIGFGVPAILMLLAIMLFFLASPIYVKLKASKSLFTGFVQVVVVAFKNRKLSLPPGNSRGFYHHKKGSELIAPTGKLRCLNKACIIRNPEQDIAIDGSTKNSWNLCTIEQVEELKALVKVLPIWSTGIMLSINVSQTSFPLLQASSMDRRIGSKGFQIPAGSFGMFTIITLALWVILYDRVIIPLASKIKGKQVRINVKLRMGVGLFCSAMAMTVSAIVENARRKKALREGHFNDGLAMVHMSAMWLVPQHCLNGLAEAFTAIGQTEFYYSEFPKSMSSIAAALFTIGMAVANLLASAIVGIVDDVTSRNGKTSWVSDNINQGRYDNYYWVLAILSFINLVYYIVCSWSYGPCVEHATKVTDDGADNDGIIGLGLDEKESEPFKSPKIVDLID